MFPDHDKRAWLAGDVSTAGAGTAVTKLVSGDLKSLSARIEKFIDNLKVDMDTVNQILLEQLNTGAVGETEEMLYSGTCRHRRNLGMLPLDFKHCLGSRMFGRSEKHFL